MIMLQVGLLRCENNSVVFATVERILHCEVTPSQ